VTTEWTRTSDPRQLTPSTCWILGAGASYDCFSEGEKAVPLTRDLIDSARNIRIVSHDVMERTLHLLSVAYGTPDVEPDEAFGSGIEATFDAIRGLCKHRDVELSSQAKTCLRDLTSMIARVVSQSQCGGQVVKGQLMIRRRTADDPPRDKAVFMGDVPENYAWLVNGCIHNDKWSVVTLNFDSILDWVFRLALKEGAPCPQYEQWAESVEMLVSGCAEGGRVSHGGYVKLHGTFDLYSCHNPDCTHYRTPFLADKRQDPTAFSVMLKVEKTCPKCGSDALPLILPPGRNKVRGEGLYHEMVYSAAASYLGASDTWVILGYSCPDYDRDVTEILLRAMEEPAASGEKRSIIVISPDCLDVGQRLSEHLADMSKTAARYTLTSVFPMQMTFSEVVENCTRGGFK